MAQLTLKETIPSPLVLRDMLEEMAVKELQGPVQGDEEEVSERIRDRYLVGILAPRQRAEDMPLPLFDKPAAPPAEDDDNLEGDFPPGDELAIEGVGRGNLSGDDGPTELSAPMSKAVFPSSLGLSFCVPLDVTALKVTPRWGHYDKAPSEFLTNPKTGTPKRVWKRRPCGGTPHEIPLQAGPVGPIVADESFPDAKIKGLIRRRADHWSVTLFLVNEGIEPPPPNRERTWMFQCEMAVEAPDGSPVFHKRLNRIDLTGTDEAYKQENEMLAMLYRRHVEFAVGHGIGVHVDVDPTTRTGPSGSRHGRCRATRSPRPPRRPSRTPTRTPPSPSWTGLVLDMKTPGRTPAEPDSPEAGAAGRRLPGVDRAGEGEDRRPRRGPGSLPSRGQEVDRPVRDDAAADRGGADLLETDAQVVEAFRFMNRAMWLQRTHSLFAEGVRRGEDIDYDDVDIPDNRSWYPFQLAFILLNLPGITRLDHPDRSESPEAVADLLWFPTGGGKTEAYLGLTAYTMALRRLQGTVEGRSGEDGVAVLMRYTLRLLTLQQFQRATALICACEVIRRKAEARGDNRWGKTPFRIGLWVGAATTPNRTADSEEAVKTVTGSADKKRPRCHRRRWLAAPADQLPLVRVEDRLQPPGKHIETPSKGRGRTLVYCGDKFGQCPFSRRQSPDEGLPVLVVDEEIYRRLPALLIATVDKFAQMPWKGEVQMLFGQVDGICERHGFRSPEIEDAGSHPKSKDGKFGAARTIPANALRPPDLIIQDELHLISGPLGTLVGLYETAIDQLCTWEVGGKTVRPKVIASTATIRKAGDQVHALFLRNANVFPPNGLDVRDNFFSLQRPSSEDTPGRKYIGICAPGRRLRRCLIRVYVALLAAAQVLFERYGEAADPWMTLVGYFNCLRELGGMRRLVDDDVRTRLGKMAERGLAKRILYSPDSVQGVDLPAGLGGDPRDARPAGERLRPGDGGEAQGGGSDPQAPARPEAPTARRAARHEHDLGRRGRAEAGPDGRARAAQDDGRVHPGDQPGRAEVPRPGLHGLQLGAAP